MTKPARFATHQRSFIFVLFIFALMNFGGSCQENKNKKDTEDSTSIVTIGADGGIVEGEGGVKIEVPAGAINEATELKITSYTSESDFPDNWAPIPEFVGAIKAEPDGLQFDKPVTITITANQQLTPGATLPLLWWNTDEKRWDATDITATVSDDGMHFTAEVTHFSGYGGGAFSNLLNSGNADAFMASFIAWYQANICKIGDKQIKNNECYEIVGFDFNLTFEINSINDNRIQRVGRKSDNASSPLIMIDYNYDVSKGNSFSGSITMTVVNYYDCAEPDFTLKADQTVLEEDEQTTVRAQLSCDNSPLIGKTIAFDLASGPGEINPGTNTTQSSGEATTTFTAGDEDAVVRSFYTSCESSDVKIFKRTQPITVSESEYVLSISFDQFTTEINFYDTYSYSGSVALETVGSENNLAGSNTFAVTGVGAGGNEGDECSMTIQGSVTFSITGTVESLGDDKKQLKLHVSPNFNTTKTLICPDYPAVTFDFLKGGEAYDMIIPVENGHTIDNTNTTGPITSHMVYVLTY
ncbi:MAG: hypothetical protein JW841_14580 [Deltaproteobacteria bacterium]|nr:hypothetical protein [Deltaproteobacteria bacterium]